VIADIVLPCGPVELARKHREGLGCHDVVVVGKRWYDSEGRKFCWKRRRKSKAKLEEKTTSRGEAGR
jgi:hypothetical protein